MIVLGVDPGSWRAGYGIIDARGSKLRHVAHGVVVCGGAASSLTERIGRLYQEMRQVMEAFRPQVMAIEAVFHARNPKSSLILGQARGVILLAGLHSGAEIREYSSLTIKQALTGFGSAQKAQVRYMVKVLLGLGAEVPLDASDALAVAICHANRVGMEGL